MPTVFILSHEELVNLAIACRAAAKADRELAAASVSVSIRHLHLKAAESYERQAQRFSDAARYQEWMWVIHRKGQ